MALIVCPGCGKEISDKATVCPKCGYVIEKEEQPKLIVCEECGSEFDESLDSCPNCGNPNPDKKDAKNVIVVDVIVGTGLQAGSFCCLNLEAFRFS